MAKYVDPKAAYNVAMVHLSQASRRFEEAGFSWESHEVKKTMTTIGPLTKRRLLAASDPRNE